MVPMVSLNTTPIMSSAAERDNHSLILRGKQFIQDYGPDDMSHPSGSLVKAYLNYKKNLNMNRDP